MRGISGRMYLITAMFTGAVVLARWISDMMGDV
jgi:hypothetical protein